MASWHPGREEVETERGNERNLFASNKRGIKKTKLRMPSFHTTFSCFRCSELQLDQLALHRALKDILPFPPYLHHINIQHFQLGQVGLKMSLMDSTSDSIQNLKLAKEPGPLYDLVQEIAKFQTTGQTCRSKVLLITTGTKQGHINNSQKILINNINSHICHPLHYGLRTTLE